MLGKSRRAHLTILTAKTSSVLQRSQDWLPENLSGKTRPCGQADHSWLPDRISNGWRSLDTTVVRWPGTVTRNTTQDLLLKGGWREHKGGVKKGNQLVQDMIGEYLPQQNVHHGVMGIHVPKCAHWGLAQHVHHVQNGRSAHRMAEI